MVNDNIPQKFRTARDEFIAMCMDAGLSTFQIAELLEEELPKLRQPFQNPEDNEDVSKNR